MYCYRSTNNSISTDEMTRSVCMNFDMTCTWNEMLSLEYYLECSEVQSELFRG